VNLGEVQCVGPSCRLVAKGNTFFNLDSFSTPVRCSGDVRVDFSLSAKFAVDNLCRLLLSESCTQECCCLDQCQQNETCSEECQDLYFEPCCDDAGGGSFGGHHPEWTLLTTLSLCGEGNDFDSYLFLYELGYDGDRLFIHADDDGCGIRTEGGRGGYVKYKLSTNTTYSAYVTGLKSALQVICSNSKLSSRILSPLAGTLVGHRCARGNYELKIEASVSFTTRRPVMSPAKRVGIFDDIVDLGFFGR
jgi:hypothetical protein